MDKRVGGEAWAAPALPALAGCFPTARCWGLWELLRDELRAGAGGKGQKPPVVRAEMPSPVATALISALAAPRQSH